MLQNTEITTQNLQDVIALSHQKKLLIGFWAPSLPETQQTIQTLHQLASAYENILAFSTLNCETEQEVAMQFGVQSLPMIALFEKGRPVDGIGGPQTEATLKEWLEKHLPSAAEMQWTQAKDWMKEGLFTQALEQLRLLITTNPDMSRQSAILLAECLLETQQFDEAKQWLDQVPMQDQDGHYKQLVAQHQLHEQASQSPEIQQLEQAHHADPENKNVAYELAIQYSQVQRHEEALSLLLILLKQDLNFADGQAKATFMDILAALGQGNPIAAPFRRQLYSLLY